MFTIAPIGISATNEISHAIPCKSCRFLPSIKRKVHKIAITGIVSLQKQRITHAATAAIINPAIHPPVAQHTNTIVSQHQTNALEQNVLDTFSCLSISLIFPIFPKYVRNQSLLINILLY